MQTATLAFLVGLAGCASTIAAPAPLVSPIEDAPSTDVARSPERLAALLARFDAMPASPERDALALQIDKVAGQRYATTSRLFWYTTLEDAKAAAAAQDKPILALRMLGRLDEDLSCANSRLFRATLYANRVVADFLRANFVLYWSSERNVPKVTIDYGDGRKIESTTTGNSAHYVLTAEGRVVDVLPGLYAPVPFRLELAKSAAFAKRVAHAAPADRDQLVRSYHHARSSDLDKRDLRASVSRGTVGVGPSFVEAQRQTVSKSVIEVPMYRRITRVELTTVDDTASRVWASFASQLWPELGTALAKRVPDAANRAVIDLASVEGGFGQLPYVPRVLDARSAALVTQLHAAGRTPSRAELDRMLIRLEEHILADSSLDELRLRPEIHDYLAGGKPADFASLNRFVYAEVFHTPDSDPWLGLLPRTDFTGVPGDGVTASALR